MAKLSAKGGLHLFIGVSLSSVISAVGTIILVRLLDPAQYGSYAVVLIPSLLVTLFTDWGMNPAIIKHLARYRSENKTAEMKRVLACGIIFESAIGMLLFVVFFFLADFLAIEVFHRPEIAPLIRISSIAILAGALGTVAQSTFIGFERMEFKSFTMICQSSSRCLLATFLILAGYGTLGAIVGYTTAFLIAGMLGIAIVYRVFYRNLHGDSYHTPSFGTTFKKMITYGLPLSISTILQGVLMQFLNFMMAIYCTDIIIGNYQAAVSFAVLITFFTTPITTVLFPAFSKIDPKKEAQTLTTVFRFSVKYASVLTIPASVAIMVLSKPLVFTLFGEKYTYTPLFLTLYSVIYLYTAFGNLSLGNFLKGQEKTTIIMKLAFMTLAIGCPMGLLLISTFGIVGLIATTLVSALPSLVTGLWWSKKNFGVTVDWFSSIKILAASAIAGGVTYLVLSQLNFPSWMNLLIGGVVFLLICLTTIPLMGAIERSDIYNLRQMLSGFGPASSLFNLLLTFMEKLALLSQRKPTTKNEETRSR
jgi:stage V sporulation protein B